MSRNTTMHHRLAAVLAAMATLILTVGAWAQGETDLSATVLTEDFLTAKVDAHVETPPADVAIFRVDPGAAFIGLDELQDEFYVYGPVHDAVFPRGAKHAEADDRHILFVRDGAGEYTNTMDDHLGGAITPVDDETLWDAGDHLLRAMALTYDEAGKVSETSVTWYEPAVASLALPIVPVTP